MATQYHLKGKGFSGRAVRVRELDPMEVEENLKAAGKLMTGQDAGAGAMLELKKTEWRNGVKMMLIEISEPCEDTSAAKWRKVSAVDLEDLGAFFTAKDVAVLEDVFRTNHEVMPAELEAIVGKALPVSEG